MRCCVVCKTAPSGRTGAASAAARAALIAPYVRGEREPPLLGALGLYEHAAGQDERARRFLEAAVAGKVVRSEVYLELELEVW